MTLSATRILALLILVLTIGLAALWIKSDGTLRNTVWIRPQAVMPELHFSDPLPASAGKVDVNLFVATLERPLFSPSRRPAPPPVKDEEKKPPPVDPFEGIHVFGLYGGEHSPTGMLARVNGKVKMVSVDDRLGEWTLKGIQDREALFTKNGEERKLPLVAYKPEEPKPPAVAGTDGAARQKVPGEVPGVGGSAEERMQVMQEAARERLRRRNEMRAKAGARPITQ